MANPQNTIDEYEAIFGKAELLPDDYHPYNPPEFIGHSVDRYKAENGHIFWRYTLSALVVFWGGVIVLVCAYA